MMIKSWCRDESPPSQQGLVLTYSKFEALQPHKDLPVYIASKKYGQVFTESLATQYPQIDFSLVNMRYTDQPQEQVESILKKVGIKKNIFSRLWTSNFMVTQGTWFDDLKGFLGIYDSLPNKPK